MPCGRACQHFSGGSPNVFVLVNPDAFTDQTGTVPSFRKESLKNPVTLEFCADCRTHMVTRRPGLNQLVVKIGTFDDPSMFKGPKFAIYAGQMQAFHLIPEGIPSFETLPNDTQSSK